jgi:hypothetical protein
MAQKNAPIDPPCEQIIEQGILDLAKPASGAIDRIADLGHARGYDTALRG